MSLGTTCFTSSGSNGVCWVVLGFFLHDLLFYQKRAPSFLKKGGGFHMQPAQKNLSTLRQKKISLAGENNATYIKKELHDLRRTKCD